MARQHVDGNSARSIQRLTAANISAKKSMFWLSVMMDEAMCISAVRQYDAPEIDGEVFISGCKAAIGEIQRVRITHAFEFDMSGEGLCVNLANRITLARIFLVPIIMVLAAGQCGFEAD